MRPFSSMASSASRESRERVVASFFFCVCMCARSVFTCDEYVYRVPPRINRDVIFFSIFATLSDVLGFYKNVLCVTTSSRSAS